MTISITWAQALAWRLERHLLDPVDGGPVAAVVGRLGAVPSMDESAAELAVRTRRSSPDPRGLAEALAAGEVIKAFAFRGAVHYLDPAGGADFLALRASGRQWELPSWVEHYRLAAADWPDFRAAVRAALSGGPLTVTELGEALAGQRAYRHLKPVFDDGAGTLIKPLSWQGDLSIGPARDGKLTVQRLDDNPRWPGIPDPDEAGPRAVLAYFRTYGPAPLENLRYWLGSGLSAGGRRLTSWVSRLDDRLVEIDVDGSAAYVAREDLDAVRAAKPSDAVRFLPGHDQWVMGPGTKDAHVTPPALRDLMTRKANPVIAGGVVSGTWARTGDELTVTWLGDRPAPRRAIEREAERLSGVLEKDLRLMPLTVP
ncbi:winged helix DNA-binding domain-containing protein [Actinoplanes bogorensis]|uniref:Winged helix DNA-binding domain-containing protein n=1 Tax=Paractinoplanes bogorensis TaxID=1610840 RepID=A0ABS5YWW2_9ACTN|nr:crosslink repair DNA glycosylase YcaQ family protein [Actinoplanes bogorensis]MBU2667940.1 winged helix DNA-binding domain-containing protein [Actinoplanes bogorensis]